MSYASLAELVAANAESLGCEKGFGLDLAWDLQGFFCGCLLDLPGIYIDLYGFIVIFAVVCVLGH